MASNATARGREWATRVVQWDPARNALKRGAHGYARVRGRRLERSGALPEIANIVAASSPKAGSQWLKALFHHPVVRRETGLFTVPQQDYQARLDKGFPLGTFVPGFYGSYAEYKQIKFTHPHRVVYVVRDPRDLVVSGYFSAVGGHRKTPYEDFRDRLRAMPVDEALLEIIDTAASRLLEVESWAEVEDPNVAKFRLEDIADDARNNVVAMLKHCGVELPSDDLHTLLQDVSRDALQEKDLAERKEGEESHYRVDRKTHRDLFNAEHRAAMEAIVPGLVTKLGYPD